MDIPQPISTLAHHTDIQPRFNDYDMYGHLNNTSVLQYFDLGKAEFLGTLTGHTTNPEAVSAVIVNINADFYATTLPGEPLRVLTGVARLSERSFTLEQRLINPETSAIKARALTIMAGIDLSTQQGAPLLPSLRQALERVSHTD